MKWAVYWQLKDDIECAFFRDEKEARQQVDKLMLEMTAAADEDGTPDWDITLLKVVGEVRQIPFDGGYRLESR